MASKWPISAEVMCQSLHLGSQPLRNHTDQVREHFKYVAKNQNDIGRVTYSSSCARDACLHGQPVLIRKLSDMFLRELESLLKRSKASQLLLLCRILTKHGAEDARIQA